MNEIKIAYIYVYGGKPACLEVTIIPDSKVVFGRINGWLICRKSYISGSLDEAVDTTHKELERAWNKISESQADYRPKLF